MKLATSFLLGVFVSWRLSKKYSLETKADRLNEDKPTANSYQPTASASARSSQLKTHSFSLPIFAAQL
jgi:hypothetical protein